MKIASHLRSREALEKSILLLLAACWGLVLARSGGFFLSHFQEANILRSEQLLQARFELWGPETDTGFRLPGPFFTWLLALPIAIGGWESTTTFLAFTFSGAIAATSLFVRQRNGLAAAALCSFGLALLPSLTGEILRNWNPSFAIPMGIGTFLIALRTAERPGKKRWWFWWGLLASLGLQVHATALAFHAAGAWELFSRRRDSGFRSIIVFLAGALLPLAPALFYSLGEPATLAAIPKGAAFVFHYFLPPFFPGALERISGDLLPVLALAIPAVLWGGERLGSRERLALRITLCQLPAAWMYLSQDYGERNVTPFLFCAILLFSLLPRARRNGGQEALLISFTVFFFFRLQHFRVPFHLAFLESPLSAWIAAALALPLLLGNTMRSVPLKRRLIVAPALLAMVWIPAPLKGGFHYPAQLRVGELRAIEEAIHARTGWNYPEFRWRTIRLGVNKHTGFQLTYPTNAAPAGKEPSPSGYFLVFDPLRARPTQEGMLNHLRSALNQAPDLPEGDSAVTPLEAQAICLPENRLCAVPFLAKGPAPVLLLSNNGISYLGEPLPFAAELSVHQGNGSLALASKGVLFHWNGCAPLGRKCLTGIAVEPAQGNFWKVTITGESLAFISRQLAPDYSEAWHRPFVEFACRGGRRKQVLLPSIGILYSKRGIGPLAPYQVLVPAGCRAEEISEIAAGRAGGDAYSSTNTEPILQLGPSRLTWDPRSAR